MFKWHPGLLAIYEVSRSLIDYVIYLNEGTPHKGEVNKLKRLERIEEEAGAEEEFV